MNNNKRSTIMKALQYELTHHPDTFEEVVCRILTTEFVVDVKVELSPAFHFTFDIKLHRAIDKIVNDFFTKLDLNKHSVEKLLLFHKLWILANDNDVLHDDLIKLQQFCNPYLKETAIHIKHGLVLSPMIES